VSGSFHRVPTRRRAREAERGKSNPALTFETLGSSGMMVAAGRARHRELRSREKDIRPTWRRGLRSANRGSFASSSALIRARGADARNMSYSESCGRVSAAGRALFLETTKVEQFREITARAEMSTARPLKREKLLIRSFGRGSKGRRMRLVKIYTSRRTLLRLSSASRNRLAILPLFGSPRDSLIRWESSRRTTGISRPR